MIVPKSFAFFVLFNSVLCFNPLISNDLANLVKRAIFHGKKEVELLRTQYKVPAVSVGVSYRGEEIWTDCFGIANLESGTSCTTRSLHRIGSITESISMLLLGKLWEENRLDLDKTIYEYLGDNPRKTFNEHEVNITLRQLVSHMGDLRHPLSQTEFYKKVGCDAIFESFNLFKDDPLTAEPGTEHRYSTFGFVAIGAVLQSVLNDNETFESAMLNILENQLGMRETCFDDMHKILLNRISYYYLNNENNQLEVAPFVDESCRWPGVGMLSNVHDLLKFGNVMIHSSKADNGFLKKATVDKLWHRVVPTGTSDIFDLFYGMGWERLERKSSNCSHCETVPFSFAVGHSGGSAGATADLIIAPQEEIVVTLLTNISPLPALRQVGIKILSMFTFMDMRFSMQS